MPASRFPVTLGLLLTAAACQGAGPYGHSRVYSPLDAEEEATQGAEEFDPVMALRAPEAWKSTQVSLFGVVRERKKLPRGDSLLTLSLRTLAERNLCDSPSDSSCRVTVSDREYGTVQVIARLSAEDEKGPFPVLPGSLIRAIGRIADPKPKKGFPVLTASYLRHWPRAEYVTFAERIHMRR